MIETLTSRACERVTEPGPMSTDSPAPPASTTCPTCGRDGFDTVTAMRKHHAHAHGESLVETVTCKWCGEEIDGHPSGRVFCSHACRAERRSAEGLPARSRQVTLTCEGCGEEFQTARSNAEAGKKYCSMECYHNDSAAKWLVCEWCGDKFRVTGEYVEKARFCSQDCYGQWISNEQPREERSRYKGDDRLTDPPDYGPGWNEEKREAVRERDGRECVDCDMPEAEHIEVCGRKLNVHHLVPARTSTNPAVHNAKRNLVTLCAGCHRKWEANPLRAEVVS